MTDSPRGLGPARWVPEFLAWCGQRGVPVDFVSTHAYAGGDTRIYDVGYVLGQLNASHAAAGGRPHIVTEWGSSYRHGDTVVDRGSATALGQATDAGNVTTGTCHDDFDAASFIIAAVELGQYPTVTPIVTSVRGELKTNITYGLSVSGFYV